MFTLYNFIFQLLKMFGVWKPCRTFTWKLDVRFEIWDFWRENSPFWTVRGRSCSFFPQYYWLKIIIHDFTLSKNTHKKENILKSNGLFLLYVSKDRNYSGKDTVNNFKTKIVQITHSVSRFFEIFCEKWDNEDLPTEENERVDFRKVVKKVKSKDRISKRILQSIWKTRF